MQDKKPSRQMNLDYFVESKRQRGKKETIPHFTGASNHPMFLPTKNYARSALMVHQPWVGKFNNTKDRDFVKEF
jgi:hypothetical protein